jgi:adenosylmethionine-8-amino-7-oxononanoate aminotransferase
MADPIPIAKAEGAWLIDENHQRYLDAISSWWVTLHGHAHPYIAQKIYEQALQLEQVIFAGFTHEPAVQLAERLLPLLPGPFERIFYSDNGSTSTEVALKMAIQYWWNKEQAGRNKILAFSNAYHGDTFGAMSVSDRSVFTLAFHEKLFEVIFIDVPEADVDPTGLDLPWDEIACFIYEPLVQGAGGMKMYPAKGLTSLLQHCHRHDIICIADEVMTGFGRTGTLFASEQVEEKPDIICLSKGLTGGTMALGVTAATGKIYEAYLSDNKLHTFFHGHSFTANPLACTAALASLDLLQKPDFKDNLLRIEKSITSFRHKLHTRVAQGQIRQLRQQGSILAFEINEGRDEYLNSISSRFTQAALERGVYLRPLGNTVYIMPPYCISDTELQMLYECMEDILNKMLV